MICLGEWFILGGKSPHAIYRIIICSPNNSFFIAQLPHYPLLDAVPPVLKNCAEYYKAGLRTSCVYTIKPDDQLPFDVYCDQENAGGGWTVFQKRLNGSVDFYRDWADYKQGFGDLSGEFWLGLDKIHRLTSQTNNELRVDLEDFDGNTGFAEYDAFTVANEGANYELHVGGYQGMLQSQALSAVYIFSVLMWNGQNRKILKFIAFSLCRYSGRLSVVSWWDGLQHQRPGQWR